MPWFPAGRDDNPGWRLDVVSLITILGESLMSRHIQPLTASPLCLLPRIIPAPQSFLGSARAARLPSTPATVCGVYSGTLVPEINYFANILLPIAELKKYEVSVWEITFSEKSRSQDSKREALVPPRTFSPLNILTVVSSLLILGAFICALVLNDGTAALALAAIASSSTLVGIASYWKPQLASRPTDVTVPQGDIIIRTRTGAFVIVHCSEEVARELFMGPEECNYLVSDQWFKVLVGIGLTLVTVSVIFLGNCEWTMQAVIAVEYMVLNVLYWVASLLPQRLLWDLSRYKCEPIGLHQMEDGDRTREDGSTPSYTRSLWFAIQATKEVKWVRDSGTAPSTPAWESWLELAKENCHDPYWDAIAEKNRLMKPSLQNDHPIVSQPIRRETA